MVLCALLCGCARPGPTPSAFPRKPITIVVYMGPGGLIDITARKFAEVAAKYTDAVFVVENKPGAGGIVAMKRTLRMPADGHTLLACTKSNISKLVATGGERQIDTLEWLAMLMADPECIITLRDSSLRTWPQILEDAQARPGKQIWLGPAVGGLDHVTALKIWDQCRMSAKWIPYKSGGDAMAALMGGQGAAYVGNPSDITGKPDLEVAAVSSTERLPQLPEVPTFREMGIEEMDEEYMWRGFAMRRGASPEVLAWYDDLFRKVTSDPEWRAHWEKGAIRVLYRGPNEFSAIVRKDRDEFAHYLARIGMLRKTGTDFTARIAGGSGLAGVVALLVLLQAGAGFAAAKKRGRAGEVLIPLFIFSLCVVFLLMSFVFPQQRQSVGASVVPRLWMTFLIPICAVLCIRAFRRTGPAETGGTRGRALPFIGLLAAYLALLPFAGYFIASFLFVAAAMRFLGERRLWLASAAAAGWIAFAYLVFYRLLYLPLPAGMLWEMLSPS